MKTQLCCHEALPSEDTDLDFDLPSWTSGLYGLYIPIGICIRLSCSRKITKCKRWCLGLNYSRSGKQSNRQSSRAGLSRDSGRSSSRSRWRSSSVSCYRISSKRIGSQSRRVKVTFYKNVQKPTVFSPMELHTEPFTKPLLNNKTKSGRHYDDSNNPWSTVGSAANQKIRPRNLKIRLLADHIFTKNQTKSKPKLAILRSKSDLFQKLNYAIKPGPSNVWEFSFIWELAKCVEEEECVWEFVFISFFVLNKVFLNSSFQNIYKSYASSAMGGKSWPKLGRLHLA